MNCKKIDDYLYDYVSELLPHDEHAAVSTHLNECAECRDKLASVKDAISALDHWSPPILDKNFSDQVLNNIIPDQKGFLQRIIEKISESFLFDFPLQAIATTAIILVAVITYKINFYPEQDTLHRDIIIESQVKPAPNPILIFTDEIDAMPDQIYKLIERYEGSLVRRKSLETGIEITCYIDKEKEPAFISEISTLFKPSHMKGDYKDGNGNIVIMLKQHGF